MSNKLQLKDLKRFDDFTLVKRNETGWLLSVDDCRVDGVLVRIVKCCSGSSRSGYNNFSLAVKDDHEI